MAHGAIALGTSVTLMACYGGPVGDDSPPRVDCSNPTLITTVPATQNGSTDQYLRLSSECLPESSLNSEVTVFTAPTAGTYAAVLTSPQPVTLSLRQLDADGTQCSKEVTCQIAQAPGDAGAGASQQWNAQLSFSLQAGESRALGVVTQAGTVTFELDITQTGAP